MNFNKIFLSSIGRKIVMSLTGFFLINFLIVHAGLNACIFANDGGYMFNRAANFMSNHWVPRVLEIGLFLGFALHIGQGYLLFFYNVGKRDIKYAVPYKNGSKWYSRSMAILGSIIFIFLVVHLANFWVPSRITGLDTIKIPIDSSENQSSSVEVHDLFGKMQTTFQNIYIVILYIFGCIALGFHLVHGFISAFKTLGLRHKGWINLLNSIGIAFSVIICSLFISMPILFYFSIIK